MALKPKQKHICIDELIWDDPVMIGLSPTAFRSYLFGIAWSKSQAGRTPDGVLTGHGISRIGATPTDVKELTDKKLIESCNEGYKILKWEEWQVTAAEEVLLQEQADRAREEEERKQAEKDVLLAEIEAAKQRQREYGSQGGKKRWQNTSPPPIEEGFDVEAAFAQAWGEWPDPSEARFTEKRAEAEESFRANITNSKDWSQFQAALMKRLKDYHGENKPKSERRKFLGAFKNFCDERWKDWIPKTAPPPKEAPPPPPVLTRPAKPEIDPLMQKLLDLEKQGAQ